MQAAAFVTSPPSTSWRVDANRTQLGLQKSHSPCPRLCSFTPATFTLHPRRRWTPSSPALAPRPVPITQCGMSESQQKRPNPVHALVTDTPPWEKLSTLVLDQDFVNGPNCASPTRERESVRLFGQKEADLRLVLYRDHAHWCPYCHKVQMLLEAKKVPYITKKINMRCYGAKPAEFLKIVPSGLLPVIQLDGQLVTESLDIMFLLEETFQAPYRKMIPTEDNEMMQAFHRYMRMERVFTGAWLGCLRGPSSMTGRGLESMHQTLDAVETSLGEFAGPFFYPGTEPSFVDINFATIFERSRSALRYWRNLEIAEGRPNLQQWFDAWETWGPAVYLRSDDWTHIGALPPQIGPVKFTKARGPVSIRVEEERSLHVLNDGPEGKDSRNQAGDAICRNHKLVVKDAIMGVKVPDHDHAHIDNVFRIMTAALFDPDLLEELEDRVKREVPKNSWPIVGNAIRFERARCCSPRDMSILAMRQFAGVINWMLRTLGQQL